MSQHGAYDQALLDEAPAATRAQRQEGYNVDLLDTRPTRPTSTQILSPPPPITHPDAERNSQEKIAPTYAQKPTKSFWRSRNGKITMFVVAVLVLGAVIGGIVGGVVGKKKSSNTSTNPSSSSSATSSETAPGLTFDTSTTSPTTATATVAVTATSTSSTEGSNNSGGNTGGRASLLETSTVASPSPTPNQGVSSDDTSGDLS
ncbi:hypothetical protein K503DRAFT_770526 [Rhizopogon vinicolor AM-OR11-026]|uniref:Uncharacterized protein n=1 Tax=Rhizopogon vinicolor AM-OR11-026 TaxID=1314800 RepID=A0A1B7N0L0_9AGAM|nr:hypothetical protein K503DRAFT_770526 [Rhizopogon vinicolor AM-OR11-026]